jgi:hypothetical protein
VALSSQRELAKPSAVNRVTLFDLQMQLQH